MKFYCIGLSLLALATLNANAHDYSRVLIADTGRVGKELVRYLVLGESPCVVIQSLVPGGKGEISVESKICSYEGKGFWDGYTDVDVKRGYFEDNRLFLEIGFTPLQPIGETIRICEVIFQGSEAQGLNCVDGNALEEGQKRTNLEMLRIIGQVSANPLPIKKPRSTNAAGLYRSGPSALRMNPLRS